jgi:hypothetical protein
MGVKGPVGGFTMKIILPVWGMVTAAWIHQAAVSSVIATAL